MNETTLKSSATVLTNLDDLLPALESVYKDLHAHPELSMHEERTARIAADRLRAAGYEVTTGFGKTGVVGLLRNHDGPTIMLRADMEAYAKAKTDFEKALQLSPMAALPLEEFAWLLATCPDAAHLPGRRTKPAIGADIVPVA